MKFGPVGTFALIASAAVMIAPASAAAPIQAQTAAFLQFTVELPEKTVLLAVRLLTAPYLTVSSLLFAIHSSTPS